MKRGNLIFVDTRKMSREQWLLERRKAIGGSDAAAVIGLNEYVTPYAVWADKTGRIPISDSGSEATRLGSELEPYVASRFEEKTGKKVKKVNAIIKNPKYPFASANIDREVVGEDAGLEIKTTSVLNMKKFKDGEFPEKFYCQCCHYMAITERKRWYLAVLILNKDFLIYQLTRVPDDTVPDWCVSSVYVSDEEITALMDAERKFWELVETDTPPDLTGRSGDTEALNAVYPVTDGGQETIDLYGREETVSRYLSLKQQIKALQESLDQCEQELKEDLGEHEQGQAGPYMVSWKPQIRRSFDSKKFAKDNPEIDLSGYYKESSFRKFEIRSI